MTIKVFYYLNQFFGGVGAETEADAPLQFIPKAVGPGVALSALLGDNFEIVLTAVCGDNYFNDNRHQVEQEIYNQLRQKDIDLVIAGPAFNAGRYGMACGAVCQYLTRKMGLNAVTAMYADNPAVDIFKKNQHLYIIPTGPTAKDMKTSLKKVALLSQRLFSGQPIGPARVEGYIPRGFRGLTFKAKSGAERALDMLEAKLSGMEYFSEVVIPVIEQVKAPKAISDLKSAKIAFGTTGGLVPKGNPDHIRSENASNWETYPLELLEQPGAYECIHGGINPNYINEDANFAIPYRAAVELERQGLIGTIYDRFITTAGCGGIVQTFQQFGRQIAEQLAAEGVSGFILSTT
ncbi:MAG: glycine/betaine/sarcosine/D-proline family reductase selenoprotein B [Firmicutes bacterium]|nr:glycine/betaine/sarcosine/D-proline family reductase selenoprotein B [Bacillota bacterium]